ncbi:hypothetical protein L2E82_14090 [Cichorium intybus]|uniref:Uncharacterized protein n=1 Tax=Cichorium intybus TaxID=13427 RepID=A0ACB9EZ04_CICIN|nr:hypothetical protein L2E82_14090 [Cichorium intybus]
MARTNKYASFNFNDIYEKKIATNNNHHRSASSSSPSSSISSTNPSTNKTALSNSRIHGNMLVLSRPSPKPIVLPRQASPPPARQPPDQPPIVSDSISLRPLGRTGSSIFPPVQGKDLSVSPKTNKFVPPHLRPGFHGREEKPQPEIQKQSGFGPPIIRQIPLKSQIYHGEEGRPKSGDPVARPVPIQVDNLVSFERTKESSPKSAHSSHLSTVAIQEICILQLNLGS